MKNKSFNKVLLTLVAVVMIATLLFAFTACNKPTPEVGNKNVTLVIVDADNKTTVISDDTDCEFVDKWLEELNSEKKITLTFVTGTYGMDIRTLNGITVNGSNKYFAFYADDAENTNNTWGTYSYNGKEYGSCAFGQCTMPLKNGCTYILQYSVYNG